MFIEVIISSIEKKFTKFLKKNKIKNWNNYSRFENAFHALYECIDHLEDENLSELEKVYRKKLIELSKDIGDFEVKN